MTHRILNIRTLAPVLLVIAVVLTAGSCGNDDSEADPEATPGQCDDLLAMLPARTAAECTALCEQVADCHNKPAIKASCANNCTNDIATVLGPYIDRCASKSCSEIDSCLADTTSNYSVLVGCAIEIGAALALVGAAAVVVGFFCWFLLC